MIHIQSKVENNIVNPLQMSSHGKSAAFSSLEADFHVCQKSCCTTFQVRMTSNIFWQSKRHNSVHSSHLLWQEIVAEGQDWHTFPVNLHILLFTITISKRLLCDDGHRDRMIKTMIMIVSLQEIDCSPPCPPLPLLWGEDQVQSDEPWKGFYT